MYNDYYLQEISGKLTTTNSRLAEIIENQETLISGDNTILNNQEKEYKATIIVSLLLAIILIYKFIERCLR